MNNVVVDTATRTLTLGAYSCACTIGKTGAVVALAKREGDGATPIGSWTIRGVLLRPDRIDPPSLSIPWRWTRSNDGWSDDVTDPLYNRPVLLPRAFSHEEMQRADAAYDIVVVLGHNDQPPIAGMGSAIFWHLMVPDANGSPKSTEGCVAVAREDMLALLPQLVPGMVMQII